MTERTPGIIGPVIDKLAWIRIENGRMLAARSRGRDVYFLPGGKRESGESDEQALIREIGEELTITLHRESLRLLHVFEAQAHGKRSEERRVGKECRSRWGADD